MTPSDPTFLSAYLDDELDEPQRAALEAQLLEDPALADALGELARVRDMVADLDRPSSGRDLSGAVLAVIEGRARSQRNRRRWGPEPIPVPKLVALSSGIAAAAVLLVTAALSIHRPQRAGGNRDLAVQPQPQPAVNVVEIAPVPAVPAEPSRTATRPAESVATRTSAPGPDAEERESERERMRMLALLDDARVRRLVVTSPVPEQAAGEVDELLRSAPRHRPRYGRLSLSAGLLVDAAVPAGATVFLVVMDDRELNYFKSRLEQERRLAVAEHEPSASVLTQLADVGQVDVLAGTPAATLERPAADIDNQVALKAAEHSPVHRGPPRSVRRGTSLPGDDQPAPAAEAPEPAKDEIAPKPEGPATVLIWVTSGAVEEDGPQVK